MREVMCVEKSIQRRLGERCFMKHYQIRSRDKHTVLFEGFFENFKTCLETAVAGKAILNHADLSNRNLSNANLDDAIMPGADFSNANLTGANMSEAYFKDCRFSGAALYNTCFYDSNLTGCDFSDASFGATDIFGTIISHSRFSTLSCFSLDFQAVENMDGCVFKNRDGRICRMSRPPLVVKGLGRKPIIFMDDHVKAGHNILDSKRLLPLARKLTNRALKQRIAG